MSVFRDPETGTRMIRDEKSDDFSRYGRLITLARFGIPPGFKRILWRDVVEDQKVYLWGILNDQPHAYGPHFVYGKKQKRLHNNLNQVFIHVPEELLVRE